MQREPRPEKVLALFLRTSYQDEGKFVNGRREPEIRPFSSGLLRKGGSASRSAVLSTLLCAVLFTRTSLSHDSRNHGFQNISADAEKGLCLGQGVKARKKLRGIIFFPCFLDALSHSCYSQAILNLEKRTSQRRKRKENGRPYGRQSSPWRGCR